MSSDKVLDKIRKLLRLAEGAGSEGEAAAAAGAAARLMAEHEVAMADLDAGEVADPEDSELVGEESVDTTGKIVPWRGSLAHSAARLFGCRMFYGCHLRGMGVPYRVVGRPRDIGAVRYTYQYLVREVERLATMAWECQELEFKLAAMRGETVYGRETAATWKTSFRLGAATTIAERVRDTRQDVIREATSGARRPAGAIARIEKNDSAVTEYVARLRLGRARVTSIRSHGGFESGRAAGHEVAMGGGARAGLGSGAARLR